MSDSMITPRKGGRPKADEKGIRLSTWVPESKFDALDRYARTHGRSLSSLLRESLERFPPNQPGK